MQIVDKLHSHVCSLDQNLMSIHMLDHQCSLTLGEVRIMIRRQTSQHSPLEQMTVVCISTQIDFVACSKSILVCRSVPNGLLSPSGLWTTMHGNLNIYS
jgi:hypothetical protein